MTQYLLSVHGPAAYDEALNYASRACQGKVEVRPFQSEQRETRRRQATGPSNAVGEIWERTTRNNGLETGPSGGNKVGDNAL